MKMPHPAIVCSGPQLLSVIEQLEAGNYPQPQDAIWRGDLPRDLAVRLAKATGATQPQIDEMIQQDDEESRALPVARRAGELDMQLRGLLGGHVPMLAGHDLDVLDQLRTTIGRVLAEAGRMA